MRRAMIHKHGVRITNVYAVCPPPRASCVDGGRKSHNTRPTNAMQMRPPPASNITQSVALSQFSPSGVVNALPGDALSTLDLTWCGRHLTLDYNPPSAPLRTSPKTTTDPFSVPLLWLRICFLARPRTEHQRSIKFSWRRERSMLTHTFHFGGAPRVLVENVLLQIDRKTGRFSISWLVFVLAHCVLLAIYW